LNGDLSLSLSLSLRIRLLGFPDSRDSRAPRYRRAAEKLKPQGTFTNAAPRHIEEAQATLTPTEQGNVRAEYVSHVTRRDDENHVNVTVAAIKIASRRDSARCINTIAIISGIIVYILISATMTPDDVGSIGCVRAANEQLRKAAIRKEAEIYLPICRIPVARVTLINS